MIDQLSVLLSRLTAARTAFLDAAVSSLAAAATAVSSATWTAAKAAFLDAAISSRLSTAINSMQTGTITATGLTTTATITSVDTTKAYVVWRGHKSGGATTEVDTLKGRVSLTNATTVTLTVGANGSQVVMFTVVEHK